MTQFQRSKYSFSNEKGWNHCNICHNIAFKAPNEFLRHLRQLHCNQEGGSFVCLYGTNNVCASLPLEGVSDKDYEEHVIKHHASVMSTKGSYGSGSRIKGGSIGSERWGVYSSTQNIPAVLNDPRKGMKRDFFTKTWGEAFVEVKDISPHVALPDVTIRHFESYVRRLRKRQRLLTRLANKEAELENKGTSPASPSHLFKDEEKIPSMFLSSSFSLEDPSTFYSVFTHITSSGISKKNSKLLQEKLFHVLELVEQNMSQQISKKSSAFFDTMMYLNAQMEQLQLNHKAVSTLRNGISMLKEEAVKEPIKILALPRQRANIMATLQKLEAISAVKEVQSTIQIMLARQEYSSALDLIATTQDLLHSELSSIKSLRHLSSELSEHEKLIDKMVSVEFLKYITEDLNRPLTDKRPLLEEDQLIAVVFGVLRQQKFDFVGSLKEEINAAINATLKQAVAEAVCEIEVDQNTTSVGDQARALPIPSWLSLLCTVTSRLRIVINRVKVIINVMTQAVEASAGRRTQGINEGVQTASIVTMVSAGEMEAMIDEVTCLKALSGLKEILCSTCDFSHDRCAKLLHARSRDHGLDKMSVSDFLSLSRVIEAFVQDTERVCGRKSAAFRMGLQGQATKFVSKFHEERDARLKLNLTSERWKAVAIPADLQVLLDHISTSDLLEFPVTAKYNDGLAKEKSVRLLKESVSNHALSDFQKSSLNGNPSSDPQEKIRSDSVSGVEVDGEEYVIVGVCVVVVRLIVEYAECAVTLRMASQQLLTRLMDLLRKFNADTCRLLVEAGAVSLGLKTITTRHLALAWRSLQLLLLIIGKLTNHFSLLLKPAVVEKYVDQLTREYQEHCYAIENKIVKVMGDSLSKPLASWEARSPVPSIAFNAILKSLSKLHETISGILTKKQIDVLFDKITKELKEKMRHHIKRLSVSPVGPQSWVVMGELTFYFNHVTALGITLRETQEEFISTLWPQATT